MAGTHTDLLLARLLPLRAAAGATGSICVGWTLWSLDRARDRGPEDCGVWIEPVFIFFPQSEYDVTPSTLLPFQEKWAGTRSSWQNEREAPAPPRLWVVPPCQSKRGG